MAKLSFNRKPKNMTHFIVGSGTKKAESIWLMIDNDKISVHALTLYKKEQNGFSCFVPGFELAFSASDLKEIKALTNVMIRAFLDFWIKKMGWEKFNLKLKELGFSPTEDQENSSRSENHAGAKMAIWPVAKLIPKAFNNAHRTEQELEMPI
jgi:hypothetical protein